MTKIEELKVAYEAATQGEWEVVFDEPDDVQLLFSGEMQLGAMQNWGNGVGYDNAHLIALMHNTLPALLEAVEALKEIKEHATPYNNDDTAPMDQAWVRWRCDEVLEKLS